MKIRYLFKETREKKGFSKAGLARAAGLTHVAIVLLESCENEGNIGTWKKIQKALKVKDADMWALINETKYIENKKKHDKIISKEE